MPAGEEQITARLCRKIRKKEQRTDGRLILRWFVQKWLECVDRM
jgi:hypothetical protein